MDKFKKSQILKLFLIASLLIIAPLLSTSLRSTYLYFIVNVLIVVVGAEAGLLSFFLDPPGNKKAAAAAALKPVIITTEFSPDDKEKTAAQFGNNGTSSLHSDKINVGGMKEQNVEKSSSTPNLFFIGGGEAEELVEDINDDDDEGEAIGGQELFQKAETFIGNFYKQLKMQREESWNKLHDLYQKAF